MRRNQVQAEALKLFLGNKFSDQSFENWLLHYAGDLHEIVESPEIAEPLSVAASPEDISLMAAAIARKLRERHLELAA